ncbi:efflux RND transporter permease subunit [Spiribacter halobius]|uniref:Acriflavin resistance protein n=1 Tax=Sediminicurvatus halobius TaxID=2182432 RepID=A0A2U2N399_9GAMM|nr:efflux RND transporter permease subunit [Spiribacter halobius]PWG63508.1 acriflavin resistance protein [Spiribacter halobius]UEX79622.1 efflux RND transporter permease subunit [Spiribacter halobius]
MADDLATLCYRRPRLVALILLLVIAAGLSALAAMGRQEDPSITNLFATVLTPYPGADPARVEALVTEKIETELRGIPEIDDIASTSRRGISSIRIELSDQLEDARIEQVWSEIRDALADAGPALPPGVPEPQLDTERTGAFTAISAILPRNGHAVPPSLLGRYSEALQDRLRQLPGAEVVERFGAPDEEVLVQVDPRRLEDLGLTAGDVAGAIAAGDAKDPAGQLRGTGLDLPVQVTGEIEGLARIARVPVTTADDGRLVRVGDLATIVRSAEEPPRSLAFADGERAVLVAVRMDDGYQVDRWMARVRAELTDFEARLPAGLEHRLLFDQSRYTAERLGGVLRNLLLGVTLVVAVLLVTLGWRAALVVAAVLPLASLLSLAVLQRLGVPIHQMSVTGLIVALGLMVDTAIVMTDEIRRGLATGRQRVAAVGHAVRRLTAPLIASTLTTALAFMPMALLPGPAGDFVGSIAIAVIVMLGASLLLSLTVTPALAGYLLPEPGQGGAWRNGIRPRRLGRWFAGSVGLAVRHPVVALMGAAVVPLLGFAAFPTLEAQFFPGVDRDQLYVQLELREGASIAETERAMRRADAVLGAEAEVSHAHWVVGESAPPFYYNMLRDRDGAPHYAEALVTTTSPAATERVIPRLQLALNRALPEAQIVVRGLVQGPPVDAPVELRLVGPELGTLRALGDSLRLAMAADPDIVLARTQLRAGAPKLALDLDEARVRLAGLDLDRASHQLDAALEGITGGSLVEGTEELPVRVRLAAERRRSVADLSSLGLLPAAGIGADGFPAIPLTALGEPRLVPSETTIYRRNGERINTVQGFVRRGVLPEEVLTRVQTRLEETGPTLPPGYRIEAGGDADARSETLRNLMAPLGLIVSLSIVTVVLTLGSFRLAGLTAVVAALAMGLSLFALVLLQLPFGIQAVIGVIGSIGVSINAAIILLTALQEDPAALRGESGAIRDGITGAARHLVSTTVTTFGGFLPLILAGGGFWPPFAVAIAGGVLLSTIVSFYFVPAAFALLVRPGARPIPARAVAEPRPA